MAKEILRVINLQKRYHNRQSETLAINDISFSVYENEILAIVGPSGCGKSTLLSIIANLENKSGGEVILVPDNKIGYMLQTDSLFPWLTILENACLGLKLQKKDNIKEINNVYKLLDKYGLKDFKDKYPNSLSGGMRQRVALIRTLATNPSLLLLDEPYSALDYQTRLSLSNDLYKIIKNEKKTVIMITHDIAEAVSMADRVIVLNKRPCTIKNIYTIELEKKKNPIDNRQDSRFNEYYNKIWRDLDVTIL